MPLTRALIGVSVGLCLVLIIMAFGLIITGCSSASNSKHGPTVLDLQRTLIDTIRANDSNELFVSVFGASNIRARDARVRGVVSNIEKKVHDGRGAGVILEVVAIDGQLVPEYEYLALIEESSMDGRAASPSSENGIHAIDKWFWTRIRSLVEPMIEGGTVAPKSDTVHFAVVAVHYFNGHTWRTVVMPTVDYEIPNDDANSLAQVGRLYLLLAFINEEFGLHRSFADAHYRYLKSGAPKGHGAERHGGGKRDTFDWGG